MDKHQARMMFDSGGLVSAHAVPAPMIKSAWHLFLCDLKGKEHPLTKVRKVDAKVYKKVTTVMADAREIGFREIGIKLPEGET